MRKTILVTGLFIGFAALVAYSRAQADELVGPPPPGSYVNIRQPMISCDTLDMIKAIAEAKAKSDDAAEAKFEEYHAITDKVGEPSCMFGQLLTAVAVGEATELPDLKFGGVEVSAWALHLGTSRSEWFSMYIETKPSKKETDL
jgi:hypothetical protein